MMETNPVYESLTVRKSVRAFEEKPVDEALRQKILLAAAAAPTAGNQQLYTILDIRDEELKKRLSLSCDNQPFIAKAPMVLIFCADAQKWYDAYQEASAQPRKPGAGDLMLCVCDAAIAAQNAVTAAESFGLGSCYIGDIMEQCETHRHLLQLPVWVFPAVMLVIGWPTRQQKEREKPQRFALQHIVHEDVYRRMDVAELRSMLHARSGQRGYEDWVRAFCERKYNSAFSVEMSRSVAEYLKEFQ